MTESRSSLLKTDKNDTISVMTSLSTNPYKGTRDYYPADKRKQNYIFGVWARTAKRYGYEEYLTPLLEPLEVYTAKSGQELAGEQTYRFTDRGEREVAIRPEMTPSVSRLVAAKRQEMAYPARLFSLADFMRYERPQRGESVNSGNLMSICLEPRALKLMPKSLLWGTKCSKNSAPQLTCTISR